MSGFRFGFESHTPWLTAADLLGIAALHASSHTAPTLHPTTASGLRAAPELILAQAAHLVSNPAAIAIQAFAAQPMPAAAEPAAVATPYAD